MLIDIHCHVLPPEMVKDPASFGARDPHFGRLATTRGARFSDGDSLLRDMAEDGVDKALAFGFAFKDTGISRLQNDYAIALAKENPGRLAALAILDPGSPGAMAEAERALSRGASGFGELFPSGHGFSLEGEAMTRLASLAAEAGVPVLIHVNEEVGHEYPGKGDAGPLEAYRFAVKNPRTTAIFAHFGGGLPFFAAMPEVETLANAYYDTAAQPLLYRPRVYQGIKAMGSLDKILFGSDYPLLRCKRYLRDLADSCLPRGDVGKITCLNSLTLLGRFFSGAVEGN